MRQVHVLAVNINQCLLAADPDLQVAACLVRIEFDGRWRKAKEGSDSNNERKNEPSGVKRP